MLRFYIYRQNSSYSITVLFIWHSIGSAWLIIPADKVQRNVAAWLACSPGAHIRPSWPDDGRYDEIRFKRTGSPEVSLSSRWRCIRNPGTGFPTVLYGQGIISPDGILRPRNYKIPTAFRCPRIQKSPRL